MSKIGKTGTILSIFSGFVFMAWAFIFVFWGLASQSSGTQKMFCVGASLPVLVFGIILVLGGFRQLKGIKEGKEYTIPSDDLK